MRQLTLTLLSLIALMATLFAAGPRQALACSCASIQPTEQFARETLDQHELVIVGRVNSFDDLNDGRVRAKIAVDLTYGFAGPKEITVVADRGGGGCGYGESLREDGSAHFMSLTRRDDKTYYASYCTSFAAGAYPLGEGTTEEQAAFLGELSGIAPPVRIVEPQEPLSFDRYGRNNTGASSMTVAAYAAASLVSLGALWIIQRRLTA
jgi:hypothetical protein